MAKDNIISKKIVKTKTNFGDHKCKICTKRFSDKSGLAHHIQLHSAERPFSCHLCSHTCKTKKYLSKHIKRVHNAATEHECSFCGRKFHYKSLLDHHMYIHTDERPFKCDSCGKGFNTSYSLNTHKYIHTDIKPFQCKYCDYACRDKSTLRKHQERHLGIRKYFQCKMCDKGYKTKRVLKLHIAEAHLDMEIKKKPCVHCGKMFKSNTTLNSHIKLVHEKIYSCKCDICGVEISNKYNMAAHLTKHVHAKPFECSFEGCTKKFKDKSTLKKHSLIHYPDQQYVCTLCERRFTRVNRLNVHMKQHRAKEKCAVCDYCGTSFYSKNYLRTHIMKKHCIKEEYKCDACGFLTYNKPSLVMHIKYGHAFELDRQCKICKKYFKMHKYLKSHYWNTHCIKYNMSLRKSKMKKNKIIIEEDDNDVKEIELLHEVKVEPLSDSESDLRSMDYSRIVPSGDTPRTVKKKKTPPTRFEDFFVEHTMRPDENAQGTDSEYVRASNARTSERYQRKTETNTSVRKRQHRTVMKIDIAGQPEAGIEINDVTISQPDKIFNNKTSENINEIHKEKETNITKSNRNITMSKLNDNYSDDENTNQIENEYNKHKTNLNKSNGNINTINVSTSNKNVNDDESVENDDNGVDDEKTSQSKRIKLNTHQCYVCFKLYETREKLINHCKGHFDVCNVNMLKKCPLCDYVTKLNLPRHMNLVHKLNIKLPFGGMKDRKNNNNGSRFFYNVENDNIKEVEVIPSVNNLNRQECVALDRKKRTADNDGLTKTKLVKKHGEWIVEKEKINVTINTIVPKINNADSENYLSRMKLMYRIAKNNGQKMLFPCDKCKKICQTLSALKLHTRKHDPNPKPFKKKVWKHKLSENELMKLNDKPQMINPNRYEKPKPIVNRHKCDPKLKEFYETNIKGGDVEFWQFLKIFNKMSRENVNSFADLENRKEFGVHFSLPDTRESSATKITTVKTKNAFKRTIMISKRNHDKRKAMIDVLRRKFANSTVDT
ncbi:protein suppressor of hairy wing-like isoform X2 [Nymphalis io]|uniref:protein suppressor of hairy wing-like isoform X2 n=1 Tax=Inachis io TaxID=171585 RepID=UPI002167BC2B|nr:protein suppressor of hairy wing-like isoform X2 [Nymphalis io]